MLPLDSVSEERRKKRAKLDNAPLEATDPELWSGALARQESEVRSSLPASIAAPSMAPYTGDGRILPSGQEARAKLSSAQLATRNSLLAARNSQLATRNSLLATRNSQLAARNSQLAARNSQRLEAKDQEEWSRAFAIEESEVANPSALMVAPRVAAKDNAPVEIDHWSGSGAFPSSLSGVRWIARLDHEWRLEQERQELQRDNKGKTRGEANWSPPNWYGAFPPPPPLD